MLHSYELMIESGEMRLRSCASQRPVAVFNAADLKGEALAALIEGRKVAEGVELKPEPERLEAAEAVLGAWPVPVSFGGGSSLLSAQHRSDPAARSRQLSLTGGVLRHLGP